MKDCKKVSEEISSDKNCQTNLLEKAQFYFHLSICPPCRRYFKHIKSLKNGVQNIFKEFVKENEGHIKKIEEDVIQKIKKQ